MNQPPCANCGEDYDRHRWRLKGRCRDPYPVTIERDAFGVPVRIGFGGLSPLTHYKATRPPDTPASEVEEEP